jgi:hypothetical protein
MGEPKNGSDRPIGNRWQTTATVSERTVRRGVDGSSPSEGSAKAPGKSTLLVQVGWSSIAQWVRSRLWSFRVGERGLNTGLSTQSTSCKERAALEEITLDLLSAGARPDDC